MNFDKGTTIKKWMEGPVLEFNRGEGVTVMDYVHAINLHAMPQLMLAYDELSELIVHFDSEEVLEKAKAYLAVIRSSIFLLARIKKEAKKDFYKRMNENQKGGPRP